MGKIHRAVIYGLSLLVVLIAATSSKAQYESLVARVNPAVVFILVTKPGIGTGSATGFFIDPNGYILTARHVVAGASSVVVRTATMQRLTAYIVNYSETADVAVLKVDGTAFPVLHLGDSDTVNPGQEVLVFGFPLGDVIGSDSVSVSRGIVSALRPQEGLIQIDAAANPGNSGGPVVTASGDVVGVLSGGFSGRQGLNFAVDVRGLHNLTSDLSPNPRDAPPAPAAEYPLTGRWAGSWRSRSGQGGAFFVQFIQQEDHVSGDARISNSLLQTLELSGHSDGRHFDADIFNGSRKMGTLNGDLVGSNAIVGQYAIPVFPFFDSGSWNVQRVGP